MKTIFSTWVSTLNGNIGLGVVKDDFGKLSIKAISVIGQNIRYDENLIAEWGGTVSVEDLITMIEMIKGKEK